MSGSCFKKVTILLTYIAILGVITVVFFFIPVLTVDLFGEGTGFTNFSYFQLAFGRILVDDVVETKTFVVPTLVVSIIGFIVSLF